MTHILHFLFSFLSSTIRSRLSLQLEIAALRHQLAVFQLKGQRPRIVGSASVQATEMALADKDLAGRLVGRAKRLEKSFQRAPQQQGPCEFCVFTTKDRDGNITSTRCGTEEECRVMGIMGLLLLLILLLGWIFSWF